MTQTLQECRGAFEKNPTRINQILVVDPEVYIMPDPDPHTELYYCLESAEGHIKNPTRIIQRSDVDPDLYIMPDPDHHPDLN